MMVDGAGHGWRGTELAALHDALVASALACGLTPSHRLALILPDHPGTALAILALAHQMSVLPLNPDLTAAEQVAILTGGGVDAVVSLPGHGAAVALAAAAGLAHLTLDPGKGVLFGRVGAARACRPVGLVLLTSGSTGTPKQVPLSPQNLWHSAQTIAQTLHLTPQDRAAHALPMFHVGALVDLVLAPLISGGSIAVTAARTPDALRDVVLGQRATWLQLVPTMLARCLAEFDAATARAIGSRLRFIRSVSADLAPQRQAEAEAHFGTILIQMYGMTETAGQIASNPLPPARRKPGSVGLTGSPAVLLLDATGSVVPAGTEGEICVQGPSVTAGYEGTPRKDQFHGQWLRSGDLGRIDADGFLFLTGRIKGMINRGGEKVAPVEVERAALSVQGVAEAVAYGTAHPTLGEQVGLAVTLREGALLRAEDVLAALVPHLAAFKLPRTVDIRTDLPRLGNGKVDRAALRRVAGATGPAVPPSPLARQIGAVWAEVLHCPVPNPEDDFFDAGGDSLSATAFLIRLEAAFGHPVPGNLLFEAPRFGAFVERLAAISPTDAPQDAVSAFLLRETAAWPGQRSLPGGLILGTGTAGTMAPVFFCAQGNSECRTIRAVLDADRPVYFLRSLYLMPGRTDATDAGLALRFADEIDQIRPVGPVYLGGFCAGARIMDRAARILRARGREIGPFLSIDYGFSEPTAYPVLHVWTACRIHPAASHFRRPEMGLAVLHPAGARAIRVRGIHTEAFTEAFMAPAGAAYERLLSGTEVMTPPDPPATPDFLTRRTLQAARLEARLPRVMSAGRHRIGVRVTNLGDAVWPSGQDAPFALTARLLGKGAAVFSRLAGDMDLPAPLAAGASVDVELQVTVPRRLAQAILHIAMVDQGVGLFDEAKSPPLRRRVLLLPFACGMA